MAAEHVSRAVLLEMFPGARAALVIDNAVGRVVAGERLDVFMRHTCHENDRKAFEEAHILSRSASGGGPPRLAARTVPKVRTGGSCSYGTSIGDVVAERYPTVGEYLAKLRGDA